MDARGPNFKENKKQKTLCCWAKIFEHCGPSKANLFWTLDVTKYRYQNHATGK